jgi:ribonuclease J
MTRTFGYYTNKTGGLSRLRYCKDPAIKCIDRDFPVNKSKGKFQLKGIEGKMFPVDHSIIGASGYILHIDGKTIAYTGDIRFHGVRGDQTEAFVSAMVSEKIDVLITEGTNVGGTDKSPITEGQVEASIMKMIVGAGDKHVFASFPVRDTDRLMSFYRAAKAAGRKLAISAGQAYLLDMLSKNKDVEVGEDKDIVKSSDKHLAIYLKKKVYGLIGDDSVNIAERRSDYESPEAEYVGTANQICWKDVRDDPDGYVMCLDNFSVQELVDIKPKEGSLYIKSTTDPLDVEMEIDWERMMNWLKLFNIRVEKAHASGHIFEKELKEILERVNAKKVIPVHTNHPEWFT